jgi:AmiR/NasT family two-component response regulator
MEYKTKLLIADESPVWRAQVREGLIRAGYRNIEEAVNGEEAVIKMA